MALKDKKIVFMFSGQGSQYYQMGRELFENNEVFRKSMFRFETMMQDFAGTSLLSEIYHTEKRYEDFDQIVYTHPALYAVQVSMAELMQSKGILPNYVIGYSLGEYVAAAVAGIFSVEDGMKVLINQSRELFKSDHQGGMMVVLEEIGKIKEAGLLKGVAVAAENYEGNFTVSGKMNELLLLKDNLQKRSVYSEVLPIKYPFHSNLILPLRDALLKYISSVPLRNPRIAFHSCATTTRVHSIDAVHFWNVAWEPIYFKTAIEKLNSAGDLLFIDLGPTGTLGSFVRLGFNETVPVLSTINKFGKDMKAMEMLMQRMKPVEKALSDPG